MDETLMDAGWTALPSILLERQQALGLDAVDVNILMHLARFWWYPENLPHPGKRTIAECIGVHESTVRCRIARLERDGLIQRRFRFSEKSGRQETNAYEFSGLITAATPYAHEHLEEEKRRRDDDNARRARKRPKFALISSKKKGTDDE